MVNSSMPNDYTSITYLTNTYENPGICSDPSASENISYIWHELSQGRDRNVHQELKFNVQEYCHNYFFDESINYPFLCPPSYTIEHHIIMKVIH